MLNGCQDDLATWQNWIVFDKPRLSQNKAVRRKRATERKETLTPEGFLGALFNQSEPRSRAIGAMTGQQWRGQLGGGPLWWPRGWKSLSPGFNGSQNSSTDQNLWTIEKWKTFVIQIGPLEAPPWGLQLEKLLRGNKHSPIPARISQPGLFFCTNFTFSYFYITKLWDLAWFTSTWGTKAAFIWKKNYFIHLPIWQSE